MTRLVILSALALAALLSAPATAQPPLPSAGGLQIIDAKAEKDKLQWTETKTVPVAKTITVTVVIDGMNVNQTQTVTVFESIALTRQVELKDVKATDGAGKAIGADKLAERLKEMTAVVLVTGAVPAKHRALFKDTTVFVELPAPKVPAPVPLPPGEK